MAATCEKIRQQKRRYDYVDFQFESSVGYAKEWAENIAQSMESKATEVRQYAERIGTDDVKPEEMMGWMINIITNMINNLNIDSAPRYAAKIAEARALKTGEAKF